MACRKHPFSFSFSKSHTNFISAVGGSLLLSWYFLRSGSSQASLEILLNNVWFRFSEKIQHLLSNNYNISRFWEALQSCENMRSQEMQCLLSNVFSSHRAFWSLFSASIIAQQLDISVYTSRHVFSSLQNLCFDWLKISLLCLYFNVEHVTDFLKKSCPFSFLQ